MVYTKEKLERKNLYYYPDSFDPRDKEALTEAFDELDNARIQSPRELLSLLYQASELLSTVYNIENELYYKSLQDTTDLECVQKLNSYRENISAFAHDRSLSILKRYYTHPLHSELNQDFFKLVNNRLDAIFGSENEANTRLKIDELRIINEYRELVHQLSFEFEGEKCLFKDSDLLFATMDPVQRAAAWNARKDEFIKVKDSLHEKFDLLCSLRAKQVANAGFSSYYEFDQRGGFSGSLEYKSLGPALSALRKHLKPVISTIFKHWKKSLSLGVIAPWDCVMHPDCSSFRPFETSEELVSKTIHILYDIRFEYGLLLNKMWNTELLNLDYKPQKAGGEFFFGDDQYGTCHIMMSCTGTHKDMVMFFHEIGHVLQLTSLMKSPLYTFLSLPLDVRELSSQALVYLSTSAWEDFYPDPKVLAKAIKYQYSHDVIQIAESVCNTLFELDIYANPEWNSVEREAAYLRYYQELFPHIKTEDLDEYISAKWLLDMAIYEYPFYDLNTSLSLFAVWQIMKVFKNDKDEAISRFHSFLGKAAVYDVQQLYEVLGLKYNFSDSTIKNGLEQVRKILK